MARILLLLRLEIDKTDAQKPLFLHTCRHRGGLSAIYAQSTLEWVLKQQVNFIQLVMLFAVLSILTKYGKEFVSGRVEATA